MMSLTCPGVDLCQRALGVASCGCPWRGGFVKPHGSGGLSRRGHSGARCRVSSAAPQTTPPVLEAPGAGPSSSGPITVSSLLEVVADDLQQLNKNLQSVSQQFDKTAVRPFKELLTSKRLDFLPVHSIAKLLYSYFYCIKRSEASIIMRWEVCTTALFGSITRCHMDLLHVLFIHIEDKPTEMLEAYAAFLDCNNTVFWLHQHNTLPIVGAENPLLMAAAEQIFSAGGKRLRPAMVFLVSRATSQITGLKDLTLQHRRLAEIIEMIHTASLIHDDVLDESELRRGKETIHQLYGTRVAVLAGDYMFAQSSWYLANLENIEVIKLISQVIKDFASGEIKQASSLFNCDLTLDEYLQKSYYKTASLVAASTKAAAIFSGASESICEQMFEYGRNLGLSFQVVDDILDFTQSAEQLGKPAGSDLANGNLTAPVIFALEKEPKLRDLIESEFNESGSLDSAIELVYKCGGILKAQDLAKEKADLAIKNLQCLPLNEFRISLEKLVEYNLERID